MIAVDGLTVEFGGTTLFKDISFQDQREGPYSPDGKEWRRKEHIAQDHRRCEKCYYEFLESKKMENLQELEKKQ